MSDRAPLSLHPVGPVPERTAVAALSDELRELLGTLREHHRSLADEPDPFGPREEQLQALLARRDALARSLAEALVRALAAGATVTVSHPDDESDGEPPVEVVEPPPPEVVPTVARVLLPDEPTDVSEPPPPAPPRQVEPPPAPRPPRPTPPVPKDLGDVLRSIGRPRRADGPEQAAELVERVLDATVHVDRWLMFPQEVQRALVGLVSSIARHVQDELEFDLPEHVWSDLRAWFPAMTRWSKLYRPGFVPGLSRRNGPEHGAWYEDAERWWSWLSEPSAGVRPAARSAPRPPEPEEEPPPDPADAMRALELALADPGADLAEALQQVADAGVAARDPKLLRALAPHVDRVARVSGFKTLKTALRSLRRTDEPTEEVGDDDRAAPIAQDWPYFALTEGKVAAVFGGDRRSASADRIRDAFRLASCTWEESDPRRVEALASRIRSRSVDLLILLRRYVAHAETDALVGACKQADVPYVAVDQGYGVGQVKLAIERYLRGRLDA